jgi:hypothetical protein
LAEATFARAETGDELFGAFLGATAGRFTAFNGRAAVRCFGLAGFTWVALCARALPAGECLVAGFSRVALAFEADFTDPRAVDREESFLTLLANGVLMRELPRYSQKSAQKQAGQLTIGLLLNQRKSRVCGHQHVRRPTEKNSDGKRKTLEGI